MLGARATKDPVGIREPTVHQVNEQGRDGEISGGLLKCEFVLPTEQLH